jgi:hypothetical protein
VTPVLPSWSANWRGSGNKKPGRKPLPGAVKKAVHWCIEHGVLPDFLQTHGSEVVNMLLTEWNWDDALEVRGQEAREELRAEYEAQHANDQQCIADAQRRIADLERQLAGQR